MDTLLKAVLTVLKGDSTLIATVPANDIHTSYNPESANYPCIVLGIAAGGSGPEIAGVTRATLIIDVYSDVNKQQLWTIYDRIKALLHHEERSITDSSVLVHTISETRVDDNLYDNIGDAWHLVARYEIVYSTTSVVAFSVEDGAIYAHATAVAVDPAKEIASFCGMLSLDIAFTNTERTHQERFAKDLHYRRGLAIVSIEEVTFKPASLNLLWSVTYSGSGTLNDGSTAATTYMIDQSTYPRYLQFLFHGTKTDDGKAIEIEASRAVCEHLQIPFFKQNLSSHPCRWICLGDSSDNVVKVAVEN